MKSFWSKLKCQWLYKNNFKTRYKAIATVLEYVGIFCSNERIHTSSGYLTPGEFCSRIGKR
ncbi:IS3 family transposase [Clostridium tanneri]|uniref:IS3 family transposase n=1 Tax=Clostridium tanneri TaxID=3037988 RepID=UPI003D16E4BE